MSGRASIWKRLGIAPTEDGRAIKKAYAARLKAIDPDEDPQAFIALREARDAALSQSEACAPAAARVQEEPERPEPEPFRRPSPSRHHAGAAMEPGQDTAVALAPDPPRKQRPSPWQTPSIDDHLHRIEAVLFAPPGEPADAEALAAEGEALLRHPEMAVIGREDQVEAWLGEAIADTIPRSDALIAPAVRHFDWAAKAEGWECPWYVEVVVQRDRDCRFRDEASTGDHGPAMRRLATPPPRRTDFLMAWAVGNFLREIRSNHPTLERDFDPETIAWWDRELAARRRRFPWAGALGLAGALLGAAALALGADALSATSAAAALAGAFAWFALKRRLSRGSEERERAEPEPLTRAEGAAAAALLLLPLAALIVPAGPLTLIAFSVAAGGLALLVGRPPPPPDEDPVDIAWQARIALLAPILWLHGALWIEGVSMQALIPVCAAAWAAFAHGERIRNAVAEARREAPLRATIITLALVLWCRIAWTMSFGTSQDLMPLLLLISATTVILHQIADPPDPWQKEWTAESVIAILAAALGGPLLALMLVLGRTARTTSEEKED